MTARFHLAQANVAVLRHPLGSPELAGFMTRLDEVNSLADGSPGFVWRLELDYDSPDRPRPFGRADLLFTLSVWESVEALRAFVYRGMHGRMLVRRNEWFEPAREASLVLWWIEAGQRPSVTDAEDRLRQLRTHGPTPSAFTFAHPHPPAADRLPSKL